VEGVARVRRTRWLSPKTFALELSRPVGFRFQPGQSILVRRAGLERSYSIASGPDEDGLLLCIRCVPGGAMSPALSRLLPGDELAVEGPQGYFLLQTGPRPVVFVATGTGVAPFLSMTRAGARGFTFLHGVSRREDLHFNEEMRAAAGCAVPCVSPVRVTDWAAGHLAPGRYDFYLCGNREMIRDFTLLVDERFAGSRVVTEVFH